MLRFETLKEQSSEMFLRDVGLPLDKFLSLLDKVENYIKSEKVSNSLKRRGIRSNNFNISDKLLLTFYYLRHYPTFAKLGQIFAISESYANKIYHKYLIILIEVFDMPNPKALLDQNTKAITIDVTEQPIERPKKGQKAYYSGKKTAYDKGANYSLPFNLIYIIYLLL